MTTNAHQFVYVLSQRGRHGADHFVATLDRTALPGLLEATWPRLKSSPDPHAANATPRAKRQLEQLLGFADDSLAQQVGHMVHRANDAEYRKGWVQLHVVRLG